MYVDTVHSGTYGATEEEVSEFAASSQLKCCTEGDSSMSVCTEMNDATKGEIKRQTSVFIEC